MKLRSGKWPFALFCSGILAPYFHGGYVKMSVLAIKLAKALIWQKISLSEFVLAVNFRHLKSSIHYVTSLNAALPRRVRYESAASALTDRLAETTLANRQYAITLPVN